MQDGEALTHGKSSAQLNPAAKAENSDNMYPCTHTSELRDGVLSPPV